MSENSGKRAHSGWEHTCDDTRSSHQTRPPPTTRPKTAVCHFVVCVPVDDGAHVQADIFEGPDEASLHGLEVSRMVVDVDRPHAALEGPLKCVSGRMRKVTLKTINEGVKVQPFELSQKFQANGVMLSSKKQRLFFFTFAEFTKEKKIHFLPRAILRKMTFIASLIYQIERRSQVNLQVGLCHHLQSRTFLPS